jgi:hypothetical protein
MVSATEHRRLRLALGRQQTSDVRGVGAQPLIVDAADAGRTAELPSESHAPAAIDTHGNSNIPDRNPRRMLSSRLAGIGTFAPVLNPLSGA